MLEANLSAQIIGFIGLALVITTWQVNKRKHILRMQMLSGLVWTLHFGMLGVYTGASMNFIVAIRNYLFHKYEKDRRIYWGSIIVMIAAAVLTWKNWTSILPTIAMILGTYGMWQKDPRRIRIIALLCPPFWFVYNVLNGSYPGMIADTFSFFAVLAGIYRFDILPTLKRGRQKKKQTNR